MRLSVSLAVLALTALPTLASSQEAVPAPALQMGDAWVFDRAHEKGNTGFSQQRVDLKVDRVAAETVLVGIKLDGAPTAFMDHMVGPDWSQTRLVDGKQTLSGRPLAFPLVVGKSWVVDFFDTNPHGLQKTTREHTLYKVVGWESVTVPAGTFRALKIEGDGTIQAEMAPSATVVNAADVNPSVGTAVTQVNRLPARTVTVSRHEEIYYAPQVKYWVKRTEEQYNTENVRTKRDTDSLVSFTPGG